MVVPRHRWLVELTNLPTTSGREHRVVDWVDRWVSRRPQLRMKRDRAGNLLVTVGGRKQRPPLIAVAHMDHPGFVVRSVNRRQVEVGFRGGVHPAYFEGAAVELFDVADEPHPGRIVEYEPDSRTGVVRLRNRLTMLQPGDVGRWRFPVRSLGVRNGLLHAPACDDLAGVAAVLAAVDRTRTRPEMSHFGVLLTRAEEEGFIGAIAAAKIGSIPRNARLLSIETSRSLSDSPLGGGPVVRVGDVSSVFDAALTNGVTEVVRTERIPHQRKLMDGGSCEATAFGAHGFRASGLCLPLLNHHNMVDIEAVRSGERPARLAPEAISLTDFDGLVRVMLALARRLDEVEGSIAARLDRTYEERRHLLE